uniref:Auxin-responsive protein SAUR36 n=1 Tax=Aegilops tauschii TaxID=37682 RepID=M8BDR5_AEGTA
MIHPKKLAQLAKKWQRKVAAGAGGQQASECCSAVADKGHCVVYSADGVRFEVPLAYLGTTVFVELLRMAGEEFGFASSEGGRITLPCDATVIEHYPKSRLKHYYCIERFFDTRVLPLRSMELQTASCWCSDAGGAVQLVYWQGVTTELRNALSTSSDAFLLSKHMAYSITATSKGSVILPSHANPNSSWDILSSSPKSVVSRYVKGPSNRLPSAVYMAQCPLSAIGDVVQHALSSLEGCLTFCHFLTN